MSKKAVYRSPAWEATGGYISYSEIYDDGSRKTIMAHREIMEKSLGYSLESWQHVHHKDENPKNNALSNLEVLTIQDHARRHGKAAKEAATLELVCLLCEKVFSRLAGRERHNRKQGKTGPYCGRSCSAKACMKGKKNAQKN